MTKQLAIAADSTGMGWFTLFMTVIFLIGSLIGLALLITTIYQHSPRWSLWTRYHLFHRLEAANYERQRAIFYRRDLIKQPINLGCGCLSGLTCCFLLLAGIGTAVEIGPWFANEDPIIYIDGKNLTLMQTPGQGVTYPLEDLEVINLYMKEERDNDEDRDTHYDYYIQFILQSEDQPINIDDQLFVDRYDKVMQQLRDYFAEDDQVQLGYLEDYLDTEDKYTIYDD